MGTFAGADVAELRELATVLDSRASAMRTIESRLTWRIHSVRWDGPDGARFAGEWNTNHRKVIVAAGALFDGVARDLRANADQQERASAADGGGAGPGRTGPGGGGSGRTGPHIDHSLLAGAGAHSAAGWAITADRISGAASAAARAGAWVDGHVGYADGPLTAEADAHGFAGALAQAGAHGRIGLDGIDYTADAEATAGLRLKVDGSVDAGPVGLSGNATGLAGATASADLHNHLDLDGVAERFKADAFAGTRADAGVTGDLLGVRSTARASAMAGIGANAKGDLTLTYDQVHLGFGAGASLGLGAGVGYDVSFSPREMARSVQDVGDGFVQGVTRLAKSPWPFR